MSLIFSMKIEGKIYTIHGVGSNQKDTLLDFYGRLMLFIAQHTEIYYLITEEIADTGNSII